ncbi:ATP-binding protein [Gracilinema caldarium]|uniref:ATP-binding protein n=1 Tax=Gracilinema caldarium TaxID=215591 RepID=UPI0026F2FCD3|nr:ATP-binding protein [Gracilinema caldarium]
MNQEFKTILIVDDNPGTRYATKKVLNSGGYTVLEAESGAEALEIVFSEKPNLLLLDLQLPDISGYEVCKQIKTNPFTQNIIVVYLTSLYLSVEHKAQGLDSGADAYLTHPVEPLELLSTIRALLRYQAQKQIHLQKSLQWETTFNALNDAVVILNQEGRIIQCNRVFSRLVKIPESEIIGQRCCPLLHKNSHGIQDCPFEKVKNSKAGASYDILIENRWYEIRIDPIFGPEGEIINFAHVMTDITERKAMQTELERLVKLRTAELQSLNKELEAFGHIVSHDLKAPVRRIQDYISLLDSQTIERAESSIRETFQAIIKNVNTINGIIEGLQKLSHLENTGLSLETLDMNMIVRSVYDNLSAVKPQNHIYFELTPLHNTEGDPILIRQVWQNLISNAIKFTSRQEKPWISISSIDRGDHIEYCIQDNGIGFDNHHTSKLFTIFAKLQNDPNYEGTGIGLALAARIIARHGGQIWAEGVPDKGATFKFTLLKHIPGV